MSELCCTKSTWKTCEANCDLFFLSCRTVNVRYEQLVKAQNSAREQQSARINNHQAASLEQVKSESWAR